MATEQHISFNADDIERYHRGLMSSKERHALEKAALDDPFLADAIEGYMHTQAINTDIAELKQRIDERTREEKKVIPIAINKPSFAWWKVAAMIVVVAGAGSLVYQLGFNNKKSDIAEVPQPLSGKQENNETGKQETVSITDSNKLLLIDSTQGEDQKTKETNTTEAVKEKVPQTTAAAPRVGTTVPAKDTIMQADIAGLITDRSTNELKTDNTKHQPSILPTEIAAGADLPVISSDNSPQARKVAAAPQKMESIQNKQGFKQPNIFRGRVTDAYNNALPFSNITNKEDNIGTYSDANGYFTLTSSDSVLDVQVRSIGFVANTVQLNNKIANNQVQLQEDRSSLAEVVISNKKANSNRSRNNTMVLDESEPADGWNNYDLYLANNLKTPESLRDKPAGSQKEVVLSFEVNKLGEPVNITVKRSLCESCDKEAIRLLKEGPKWKRKTKKGKASVTITF